ncbi:MAG: MerR family transcriptional regulator [Pseudomonadota bacterium]
MTTAIISISELSRQSGVSNHTLRYYEKEGVLAPATRAANGHRRYRTSDVAWLAFVLRLKVTGMPLAEIKRYAALRSQGETTVPQRLAVLELHRERLVVSIQELVHNLAALDDKIGVYRQSLPSTRKASSTSKK